jgi:hypothetical protein
MNESDDTAQAQDTKPEMSSPMFLSGSSFFLSGFPLKHAGMTAGNLLPAGSPGSSPENFRGKNEEVLKFYGGKKL